MPVMRELLAHAVPSLHPRLFSMFDRLGPTARNLDVYRRLNDALHGPAAEAIFEADQVSDHLLSLLDRIAKDRVLWAARKAIGTSDYGERSLTSALAFLRAHGLAFAIETLPPGSGWRAVLRRLKADLGRARGPVPAFLPPDGWRRVETMAQLWMSARR
jgi:hypothetical protein